jgi:hypothetical protein
MLSPRIKSSRRFDVCSKCKCYTQAGQFYVLVLHFFIIITGSQQANQIPTGYSGGTEGTSDLTDRQATGSVWSESGRFRIRRRVAGSVSVLLGDKKWISIISLALQGFLFCSALRGFYRTIKEI